MPLLHSGDTFPELTLTVPGGQTVTVPEAFAGQFGVLLLYRGILVPLLQCPAARLPACRRRPDRRRGPRRRPVGRWRGRHRRADRQARPDLPRRVRRRRAQGRGPHRGLRQPRPGVPPVHRVRPRPAGQGRGQRLFQRGHRPARARRRGRARPLRPRAHPGFGLRIGRAAGQRQSAAPVRDDDFDFSERMRLTPGGEAPDRSARRLVRVSANPGEDCVRGGFVVRRRGGCRGAGGRGGGGLAGFSHW